MYIHLFIYVNLIFLITGTLKIYHERRGKKEKKIAPPPKKNWVSNILADTEEKPYTCSCVLYKGRKLGL